MKDTVKSLVIALVKSLGHIFSYFLITVFCYIGVLVLKLGEGYPEESRLFIETSYTSIIMAAFYFVYILIKQFRKRDAFKKPTAVNTFLVVSFAVLMYFVINVITALLMAVLPDSITETYTVNEYVQSGQPPLLLFAALSLLTPITEEVLFRYKIQNLLARVRFKGNDADRVGVIFSIVMQALLFGLMHLNVIQSIYAFICGLVLGYIYYKTKNLLFPILFHMMFNTMPVIITYGGTTAAAVVTAAAVLVFAILFFGVAARKESKQALKSEAGEVQSIGSDVESNEER